MQIYQVTHIETGMKKNLNKHNTNKETLDKKRQQCKNNNLCKKQNN